MPAQKWFWVRVRRGAGAAGSGGLPVKSEYIFLFVGAALIVGLSLNSSKFFPAEEARATTSEARPLPEKPKVKPLLIEKATVEMTTHCYVADGKTECVIYAPVTQKCVYVEACPFEGMRWLGKYNREEKNKLSCQGYYECKKEPMGAAIHSRP